MENKYKLIGSLLAVMVLSVATAMAAQRINTLGPGQASMGKDLKPTFEKGFSAGLRPAPTQCFTDVSAADLKRKDYNRVIRGICEKSNPRKNFCVDYCVNKANSARKSLRTVSLAEVPKADCLKPINKNYATPDECTKERMRHCSANCERGRDQNKCSHSALVYCRRQGGNPFLPNAI